MTTSPANLVKKKKSNAGRKPKPTRTIAIDCGSIAAPLNEQGGIATITTSLLIELARIDKRNRYLLYSFAPLDETILMAFGGRAKNRVSFIPQGYKSWWLKRFLQSDAPDVFLALSQAMPQTSVPTIGFIYDLAFIEYPNFYTDHVKLTENTQYLLENAQKIITVSKASKQDIHTKFLKEVDDVEIICPGVDGQYKPQGAKYIGPFPYFLYVGALKKTKNIPMLLKAFAEFLRQNTQQYQLVLIGSDANMDEEIPKTITELHLEKQVSIKGYVPIVDLPAYYRGAVAFVSPALYEGFGLPVLEAMASGTPVIVGNNSSMPEIVGKAGILVDSSNKLALYKALMKIVNDPLTTKQLIKRGVKRARDFTWASFAKKIIKYVEQTAR